MLRSFDPFSPAETTTTSDSDSPTTHQTNRSTYELGRFGHTYDPQ
jgi:hypothetical protein